MNQNQTNQPNFELPTEPLTDKVSRNVFRDYLILLFYAGILIVLDTWTKELVETNLSLGQGWLPEKFSAFLPYFRIIHLQNKGTAFGMFQDQNQINLVISTIAVIASLFIIYIFPKIDKHERTLRIALILQLAGAVGNLISRIRYGYVLDFISVGNFPVFNIADSCITVGLVVLILGMFWQEYRDRKQAPPPETDSNTP